MLLRIAFLLFPDVIAFRPLRVFSRVRGATQPTVPLRLQTVPAQAFGLPDEVRRTRKRGHTIQSAITAIHPPRIPPH